MSGTGRDSIEITIEEGSALDMVMKNYSEASEVSGGGVLGMESEEKAKTNGGPPSLMVTSNEQPVSKRQKMDEIHHNFHGSGNGSLNGAEYCVTANGSSNHSYNGDNNESSTSLSSLNSSAEESQLLRTENGAGGSGFQKIPTQLIGNVDEIDKGLIFESQILHAEKGIKERASNRLDSLKGEGSSSSNASTSSSSLTTPSSSLPDLLKSSSSNSTDTSGLLDSDMLQFQNSLAQQQCLCGVSERILRRPFQSHYINLSDQSSIRRIAALNEWPTTKLIQFLSNLQLLFDIYLKQNSKGHICCRIMDVCEALIRNEHNLIDEIIELSDYDNKYVQFLSGRVLSSFLVIAKDEIHNGNDSWLKTLIDNLFMFDQINSLLIRRISFSLEIVKRIVEWKDVDLHPLEADDEEEEDEGSSDRLPLPPLENNYFAVHYNAEMVQNSQRQQQMRPHHLPVHSPSSVQCQIVSLTDSESFDTSNLKCTTIKNLENKWPALVEYMKTLIENRDVNYAESCVVTFLQLWECIISVHTNLSIVETLPFYAHLGMFERLLLNDSLPCTIYKQMLALFNEALCYGNTLALQDMLPQETCDLAHQVVLHVKDYRILHKLPRSNPENPVNFIGNKRPTIAYETDSFNERSAQQLVQSGTSSDVFHESIHMDKVLLQKMVLLVLKSVAVTVKEIRSDSSDSSIDSTDYEAIQDMVVIERSITNVLKKLENFLKNTLQFHPECHFSNILIRLFGDQDDYLIEAMVCTLDVTVGISFRNNAFPELVSMLNPVLTFLEFLKMISHSWQLLLDLLRGNETCFLLYLLRFLKYILCNWSMFEASCRSSTTGNNCLRDAMKAFSDLRCEISRQVSRSLFPYDITPVLRLLNDCESLYGGFELS